MRGEEGGKDAGDVTTPEVVGEGFWRF